MLLAWRRFVDIEGGNILDINAHYIAALAEGQGVKALEGLLQLMGEITF